MKNFKRIILPLFLLALILALVSCKPNTTDEPSVEMPAEIVVYENGQFNFTLTRPEKGKDTKLYSSFYSQLKEVSGCEDIEFTTDAETRDKKYDPEKQEILCGYTKYPESQTTAEYLEFEGYKVSVVGNKLSVTARTSASLEKAIEVFIDYAKQNTKDGRLAIPKDFCLTGKALNSKYNIIISASPAVKAYESAEWSDCGDNVRQVTLKGVTKEIFEEYNRSLADEGYDLHAENNIAGNLFATYTKDNVTFHNYFIEYSKEMRIVVSKGKPLPSTEEVKYTKVTEPSVTLMGLEKSGEIGGMGIIIQLPDGSFIVYDGGNNKEAEAKDLRDTLLKLAPDKKKVIIRAWVISHGHGDHYGAFVRFSKNYAKSGIFTVESFIYNFCDTPEQKKHSESCTYDSTNKAIVDYWPNATVYKGLTGQVYKFAGCELEVLYCMSDFLPQIIGEEKGIYDINKDKVDGNIETMVVRAKIGGQTLLLNGDTTVTNINEMCKRYGDELKSDIMTVPHHGHNRNSYRARNSTKEFYTLIDPETVLWPCGASEAPKRLNWNGKPGGDYENNYYLINQLNVKEYIVAGSTTKTLPLPYKPKG